jgi:hypothetical protein
MIKPRGPKAKLRKPKVEAATALSKHAKKSDGEHAVSNVAKAQRGTLESDSGTDVSRSDEPQAVPLALAGRWIAWSADGLRIIGSGATLKDAEGVALQAGEIEPIFQRAVGMYRR